MTPSLRSSPGAINFSLPIGFEALTSVLVYIQGMDRFEFCFTESDELIRDIKCFHHFKPRFFNLISVLGYATQVITSLPNVPGEIFRALRL